MKCDSQNADEIDAHNTVIVKKNGVEDNIYGSIRKRKTDLTFLVLNTHDQFAVNRVLIFDQNGKDLWKYLCSKEIKGSFNNHKERGCFHREQLFIQGVNVYDPDNSTHKLNAGASWYASSFESSNFIDESLFNKYQKSKGQWFEMSSDNFVANNLMDPKGRKEWVEKIYSKYHPINIQFESVQSCEKDTNVYGGLLVRKPNVKFTAVMKDDEISHVIIHDENGLDLRKFLLSKEKNPKFQSPQDRGAFQRNHLCIQDMHVYDAENSYHVKQCKDSNPSWLVKTFEESNLHDESLFEKYKNSKGGWYEMSGDDFDANNLQEDVGRQAWVAKIQEKYDDWNIIWSVFF